MKLKKRRTLEVPPKIKAFIDSVTAAPLENIDEALKGFTWDFDKGDFHHWVDLFNHFDSFFEKHIKPRKDLLLEDEFLEADPPFLRESVLQILRVIRIILDNCTNKHFYSYYEQHLSSLLASTDADVVEAALQTLTAFLKKTIGKCSIRDTSLTSRLFALAQGWGGKEEGLGLVACSVQNGCDSASFELGCTLHFEFYAASELAKESVNSNSQGLQVIHVPNVNSYQESELELLNKLVTKYNVPPALRFSLLTRLRFARAFGLPALRQQYICIRLYAFVVLVQASHDADDLSAFFNNEPEFVNELVSLISLEDAVPEKISILSILALVALCQDRSRQPNVLTAVTSGCHREILPSLMQKAIESISSNSSKWSILFAETLMSLVTILVSSSSGCSALREAGFIPALLPLLKDTNPQHLHLVGTAVHVLEAFMDYSNPAAALYRDLGGLDDTIARLNVEVSLVENNQKEQQDSALIRKNKQVVSSSDEMDVQPLYSQALISYHRRFLMKALLRAISLGTYAPGSSAGVYGSEESLLPHCLCTIFRRAKDFGGGVFSLAATVMSDLIHKDPTCFPILDAAGLPSAFLDAILGGVLCSAEAVTCIPQCLDALCLNNSGLQAVRDCNGLRCFVKIFTSRTYLRALIGDTPGSLSTGLDELMRHASSLRGPGVDMLIEILSTIKQIGSGAEVLSVAETVGSSVGPIPMETDTEEQNSVSPDDADTLRVDSLEQLAEVPVDGSTTNIESFLPECISNVARLMETILQNADTCRIFIEKKGIDAILQLFTMQSLPPGSIGHGLSVAFKNFSPQHSAALARSVCTFLREQLKMTNELLVSVGATSLVDLETAERTKILKCLSSLEGLLSLSNFLLKGTTTMLSELGSPDADILKDLGNVYKEILWKISLSGDQKVVEKQNADKESRTSATVPTNVAGREIHDDRNLLPVIRYLNSGSLRNTSDSHWTERELLSVVRSRGSLHRHSRHGFTRIRSSQMGRHLDSSRVDSDGVVSASETSSVQDPKKKSPEFLVSEIMNKLASIMRSFLVSIVKGLTAPNRRRTDSSLLSSASKNLATALSKFFHEALSYSGNSGSAAGLEMSLSVKCRYLGKVVDDMIALIFDSRRRACHPSLVNNFYVHGTFKELLTTFEATSQLLWTLPFSVPVSGVDQGKSAERNMLSHNLWLLDTLQSYCRMLEYFVNSAMILSSGSSSQAQLLVQPVAAGLSIGLFPVPRDPDVFVRMLQSQVLDVILPVWNHPMFPNCSPTFISSVISIVTHIYSGVGDIKHNHTAANGSINQQLMGPPPDETTIATIVEMGFSRARAEEALRRVEMNNVEMAMEWLFSHAEDPVQEDDELARALALSLGNSSETAKEDSVDKTKEMYAEERGVDLPPVEDILTATANLFHSNDLMAFPLTDLLVTLSNRSKCEDRRKVTAYLIQQLKLCPSDFSKDTAALSTIAHVLALLLNENSNLREIAAENGVVSLVLEILSNHKGISESRENVAVSKCLSALLLILDSMLQLKPKASKEIVEGNSLESLPDSSVADTTLSLGRKDKSVAPDNEKEPVNVFEKILGKSTGYLTLQESDRVLMVCCELIKQHVPAIVMQAVLQLCARLTKTHSIAIRFLEKGGLAALFNLPRSCFFPGYDSVASAIVRHLLEDPQTLQTAMELEIRQTLTGVHSRHGPRLSPRTFLTSMAPVIARDPVIFMKAAAAVCQLESSGGRMNIVLLKEKEKEKDKSKLSGAESLVASNEHLHLNENKLHDGPGKCSKGHKKIPASLGQVVDQLLEIIMSFPSPRKHDECVNSLMPMDLDEPLMKEKGKSKVDEIKMESDGLLERSTLLAKVTFVLKLMSDILVMYAHAAGVILKRDSEMCQYRGSNQVEESAGNCGILHRVLHQLLTMPADRTSATADEWKDKLSEKASWFLVVLCGRSAEGRRRVVAEIMRAFSSFLGSNSSANLLLPNKKVLAYVELVNSILSKNLSSSTLPSPGCSPDVAKTMIDGGIVQSLSSILQVIDLDHPDAPKVVNVILKALECLTKAANASEQVFKQEGHGKKKAGIATGNTEDRTYASSGGEIADQGQTTSNHQQSPEVVQTGLQIHRPQNEGNEDADVQQILEQDVGEREDRNHSPGTHRLEFMREEVEEGSVLQNTNGVSMSFQVEHRTDDDMVDEEDDDMGDGEDDDEEDEDEEEDEDDVDVAEGATLISIGGDTDTEDHDDNGLGDAYNDDIMDDEDEDFHENRVIEVRWREGLLQVLGRPGALSGLIDVAAEPFQSLNVDDVFGLRRPLGVERRRHTASRTFIERSGPEGNTFRHPLLLRPSQTGDSNVSVWSSAGNSLRESEALSVGSIDMAHFYMFDSPVFPSEHTAATLFGDRLVGSTPPPLIDFSLGSDSMHLSGRRGLGDGRWTDDGQPQAGGQATFIAQAVEEHFVSHLRGPTPVNSIDPRQENLAQEGHQMHTLPPNTSGQPVALGVDNQQVPVQNDDIQNNVIVHDHNNFSVHGTSVVLPPESAEQNEGPLISQTEGQGHQESDGMNGTAVEMSCTDVGEDLCGRLNVIPESVISCGDLRDVGSPGHKHSSGSYLDHTGLHNAYGDVPSGTESQSSTHAVIHSGLETHDGVDDGHNVSVCQSDDVDMNGTDGTPDNVAPFSNGQTDESSPVETTGVAEVANQPEQMNVSNEGSTAHTIDPTFLEALPEDLRAEVLASQQAQSVQAATYAPPSAEEIDPEFLAALPPDIQAEVLAQQRAQRVVQSQQASRQPVEMDNASIIATFPADLREEVLLTSSEAVLSALPSPLLAEAQMLRDRAMSHYHARSLFGGGHRLSGRRNSLAFERHAVMDRGVGGTISRRTISTVANMRSKEIEGTPLLDADALKALIRLLRVAQPLGKGLLQRLLMNLCVHTATRATLVHLMLNMITPEVNGFVDGPAPSTSQRLYGCQWNVVYSRPQRQEGLPPLVSRRILEILTYLATNHVSVANILFYFDTPSSHEISSMTPSELKEKGKEKMVEGNMQASGKKDIPLILFLKLLNQPLFLRSSAHLEQVMNLLQVIVNNVISNIGCLPQSEQARTDVNKSDGDIDLTTKENFPLEENQESNKNVDIEGPSCVQNKIVNLYDIMLQLPESDLCYLCSLLAHEGLSDKVYSLAAEVLKKLASVAAPHRKLFTSQLAGLANRLSGSAMNELTTLRSTHLLGLRAGSMAGAAVLRVLQSLSALTSSDLDGDKSEKNSEEQEEQTILYKLNVALGPLWQELSECISLTEAKLGQSSTFAPSISDANGNGLVGGGPSSLIPPLPPGTQRLLPFIEAFFVLCEKLQANNSMTQQEYVNITAREVKESGGTSSSQLSEKCDWTSQRRVDGNVTFSRFTDRHRRLLNAFIRQNPGHLEKSLSMMLKAPRLIDFDNKKAYFHSRIRQQHEQLLSAPLRISVRRAYVLEDSYNQLRMRPIQDMKGRLTVQFQGEEGIDAGGLTREWYQLLSRVIFDKGALLFTTVGSNSTFQPNPNSVYQTEHLSYFKFVGRLVGKALFDGQLLDVYFTRSFYKHILGVKVTYHDIEAVDPDYYKNLKWMLENDVSEIPDLTFSMDADEEKLILYERTEVTDYELIPGGRNIRVTEDTKHEYVDLVAEHILSNAIRPQINSFLDGFYELVPRDLVSIFNDKELELLISGLPEIDLDDLKENTEYTGYTAASGVVQWFWEVVKSFNKEDMARFLQFVTGTSKVPLEGFKALQGISGPQHFQIHKAYGAPERLPSAHTCFNQLDLPEYPSKEQLQERLLLAIHEGSEGFGFG